MKPIVRGALTVLGAALALAILVPSAVGSFERQREIDDARSAVAAADTAVDDYWEARFALADAVSRASALAAISELIAPVSDGVDSAAAAVLLDELAGLHEFAASDAVLRPAVGLPVVAAPHDDATATAAHHVAVAAEKSRQSWASAEAEVRSLKAALAMHGATAQFGWAELVEGAPAAASDLVAANSSAVAGIRIAVTDAAADLAARAVDRKAALVAYASTISELKKSHADEQARIAAEAAAAAAAAPKKRTKRPNPFEGLTSSCVEVDAVTGEPWQEEWFFDGIHQFVMRCTLS